MTVFSNSLLDEFIEFSPKTLEVLRQPIEDKKVTISRAKISLTYPANFMVVAATNPCPCGYYGDPVHHCTCADSAIRKYRQRVSGPLLDRIDIHMDVPRVDYDKLTGLPTGEASAQIRERVEHARQIQRERFAESPHLQANADMGAKEVDQFCETSAEAADLLKMSLVQMQLSARAYHRILKLARTIADLDESEIIEVPHLAEAIHYRPRRLTG